MFTTEQLNKAKELAYINWEKCLADGEEEIGFEYKGMWIANPFIEESGRFEFLYYETMCGHYGRENVENFIKEILEREAS